MKLRLRHYQGGPTQRLEVEIHCTLRMLKGAVASLTGQNENSVRISLNKVEELDGPGNLLVSSLGICGGDLLYLLDPRRPGVTRVQAVSSEVPNDTKGRVLSVPRTTPSKGPDASAQGFTAPVKSGSNSTGKVDVAQERRERCAAAAATRLAVLDGMEKVVAQHGGSDRVEPDSMEIDNAVDGSKAELHHPLIAGFGATSSGDGGEEKGPTAQFAPQPSANSAFPFLQRVLSEVQVTVHSGHDLLVLAIHAVMLDTGFKPVGSGGSRASVDQCWQRAGGRSNAQYTLASAREANPSAEALSCTVRCQQLGRNLVVYGSCDQDNQSAIYRLNLQLSEHLPPPAEIQTILSANLPAEKRAEKLLRLFKNTRQLWREAKDVLAVPLLSALRQRAGLSPPVSLVLLPVDVKNNILSKLSAKDLVAVSVTCSELREAASSDEFWKALFEREFPHQRLAVGPGKWKEEFRRAWVDRKLMQERREEYERRLRIERSERRGFRYQPPGMVGEA
jgi:F-box protein 7